MRVLFEEHYHAMVNYANQLINDQEEATEMVVNTFIKLITMRLNFKTAGDVKTFLLVTIRNSCYDYLRCAGMERPAKKEILSLADLVPTGKGDEPLSLTSEMLLALYEGIDKLTGQRGEIFKLFFYNKMTAKDIAAQLNLPLLTVQEHKAAAIQQLRPLLEQV